jgi:lipopolysaccharide assembly outer membrane protein LptD (OstA)
VASAPGSDEALPEPGLKSAPQLVPPPGNPPAPPSAGNLPRAPSVPAAAPDGAIFLRADRVDGTAEQFVEASGKVELRTRRETVLADWLRYDSAATRSGARATC